MIKKPFQRNSLLALVALLSLLLIACNKEQPAMSAPTAVPAKSAQPAAVPSKPLQSQNSSAQKLSTATSNQFDFSNKKDPFKPFVIVKSETKKSPVSAKRARRNALPIHSFDVGQFKLIGLITGDRENKAMVTDPAGKGYVLKVGMLIGKNDGRITSISSNGVDILEQFKDDNGRVRKEHIKLTLPKKQ